jgi:hypothetical protein
MPIWPLTGAIFKNAPHPKCGQAVPLLAAAARAAGQARHLVAPQRRAAAGGSISRSCRTRSPTTTASFLTDQAQVAELRKRFEGYTGPIVNAGGVR